MDKIKQWTYYCIIGIVSLIALCFLPMIGSEVGLAWNVPNTFIGWTVWLMVKLIVAVLNVLIFHCFMLQAKLNVKDNEQYIEAQNILRQNLDKEFIPRSPNYWTREQYNKKGVTIFITTALSTIALTQALLTFDWMAMLTYLFTIIMGLIFGIMQMKNAEDYWVDEFWQYAKMVEKDLAKATSRSIEQTNDTLCADCRTDILDSSMGISNTSNLREPLVVDSIGNNNSILGWSLYSSYTPSDWTDNISEETTQENKIETTKQEISKETEV